MVGIYHGGVDLFGAHTLSAGWNSDGLDFSQQGFAQRTRFNVRRKVCQIAPRCESRWLRPGPAVLRHQYAVEVMCRTLEAVEGPSFFGGSTTDWDADHRRMSSSQDRNEWISAGAGDMEIPHWPGEALPAAEFTVFGLALHQPTKRSIL